MNPYTRDGIRWLRRASKAIPDAPLAADGARDYSHRGTDDACADSVLFFAFGTEKLLKGVLFDINPLFVFEDCRVENVSGILYKQKMTAGHRNAFEQSDANGKIVRRVHNCSKSLQNAKHFSQTACNFSATITKLFDERGIIAHQDPSLVDPGMMRFVRKHFSPVVEAFVAELHLDPKQTFVEGRRAKLGEMSDGIKHADDFDARMTQLIEAKKSAWDARKVDSAAIAAAEAATQATLERPSPLDELQQKVICPVCKNASILFCNVHGAENVNGTIFVDDISAASLRCFFCGLEIHDYEEVDYFKLDEFLHEALSGGSPVV